MTDYSHIGAVCFECAKTAGFVMKKKAVGVWVAKCGICHEWRMCTDLWHDWKPSKKESKVENEITRNTERVRD